METKLVNFKDNLSIRLHSLRSVHGFDPVASEEAMLSLTPSAALVGYFTRIHFKIGQMLLLICNLQSGWLTSKHFELAQMLA